MGHSDKDVSEKIIIISVILITVVICTTVIILLVLQRSGDDAAVGDEDGLQIEEEFSNLPRNIRQDTFLKSIYGDDYASSIIDAGYVNSPWPQADMSQVRVNSEEELELATYAVLKMTPSILLKDAEALVDLGDGHVVDIKEFVDVYSDFNFYYNPARDIVGVTGDKNGSFFRLEFKFEETGLQNTIIE